MHTYRQEEGEIGAKGAVIGTAVAGGGAGGGVAVYSYANGSFQGIFSDSTIEAQLVIEADNANKIGIPITKLESEKQSEWWTKAYHRYFLEISGSDDEIPGVGGESIRAGSYVDKSKDFKSGCVGLLEKNFKDDSDSDFKKAKKWCTTYKTVMEIKNKQEGLEGMDSNLWGGLYTSISENSIKSVVDSFKDSFSEYGDLEARKRAVHKWCTMALDASQDFKSIDSVESFCDFKQ